MSQASGVVGHDTDGARSEALEFWQRHGASASFATDAG